MSVHKVKGEYLIYKAKKSSEMKFRKELSRELIENFENKIYISQRINRITYLGKAAVAGSGSTREDAA